VSDIFAGRSCAIRDAFHANAFEVTRAKVVVAGKRYRGKENVWRL